MSNARCTNTVTLMWRRNGTPVTGKCGTWHGDQVLCNTCEDRNKARYPQGWQSYPGDTCKHGVYVGGCGVDYMCGRCEFGEDGS